MFFHSLLFLKERRLLSPLFSCFESSMFFARVLFARHSQNIYFSDLLALVLGVGARNPGFLVPGLWCEWWLPKPCPGNSLDFRAEYQRPPGSVYKWWLSTAWLWYWSNCSPVETEIERVQHLHFPLVVFLLILCIWKRQPYANCWLTIFPGMETIWIISMSFS